MQNIKNAAPKIVLSKAIDNAYIIRRACQNGRVRSDIYPPAVKIEADFFEYHFPDCLLLFAADRSDRNALRRVAASVFFLHASQKRDERRLDFRGHAVDDLYCKSFDVVFQKRVVRFLFIPPIPREIAKGVENLLQIRQEALQVLFFLRFRPNLLGNRDQFHVALIFCFRNGAHAFSADKQLLDHRVCQKIVFSVILKIGCQFMKAAVGQKPILFSREEGHHLASISNRVFRHVGNLIPINQRIRRIFIVFYFFNDAF